MGLERDEVVGMPTGASTIHIERAPVSRFAKGVTDSSPVSTLAA